MTTTPTDSSSVIKMEKEFKQFLSKGRLPLIGPPQRVRRKLTESVWDESLPESCLGVPCKTPKLSVHAESHHKMEELSAELASTKAKVTELETQLTTEKVAHGKIQALMENQLDSLKLERQKLSDHLLAAQSQLQLLQSREKTLQSDLQLSKGLDITQKKELEDKVGALKTAKYQLQRQIEELQISSRQRQVGLERANINLQAKVKKIKIEKNEVEEQLQLKIRKLEEAKAQNEEFHKLQKELAVANSTILDLKVKVDQAEEDKVIQSMMTDKMKRLKELEQENRRLKDDNNYYMETQDNAYLLREENHTLKQKNDKLSGSVQQLATAQAQIQVLQDQQDQWTTAGKSTSSPSEMLQTVIQLQTENALLVDRNGQLQSSKQDTECKLNKMTEEVTQLRQQLMNEQCQHQELANQNKRLQKKLLLVTKERDSNRNLLDSYESEMTTTDSHQRTVQLEQIIQAYHHQIDQLDRDLEDKQKEITGLRLKVTQWEQQSYSRSGDCVVPSRSAAESQLTVTLRQKIEDLSKSLEAVTQEKCVLEDRLERKQLQGDFDPLKTKVVHLIKNPADIAFRRRAATLSDLQKENEKLQCLVKAIEESGVKVEDFGSAARQIGEDMRSSVQVQVLKEQLSKSELKHQRLREVFTKTSQEFREACYTLLGFRVDAPLAKQYKVQSIYAESPEDFLVFKQTHKDKMQLLQNSYTESLQELVHTYLDVHHSIPAFLSALTIDLFKKQTILLS